MVSFFVTAIIMFAFWMLLSGEFSFILILSGIASSLFVSYLSHDLLIGKANAKQGFKKFFRIIKYTPWLILQILIANIDLVYRTLHPRMLIDPMMISFKNKTKTDMGVTVLANSITLTPGTVTIEADKGNFVVHAISKEAADSLKKGTMQRKVRQIEGQANV